MLRSRRRTTSDLSRVIAVLLVTTLFGGIIGCAPPNPPANAFSDEVIVRIHDYQDRRLSDSLYQFLSVDNALHRAEAAMAFASVQDTAAAERLGTGEHGPAASPDWLVLTPGIKVAASARSKPFVAHPDASWSADEENATGADRLRLLRNQGSSAEAAR